MGTEGFEPPSAAIAISISSSYDSFFQITGGGDNSRAVRIKNPLYDVPIRYKELIVVI